MSSDLVGVAGFGPAASSSRTSGIALLAVEPRSVSRVWMAAQDSRSGHGLLYLAAVRDNRRKQEHCQGRVDIGSASLTAPEAVRPPSCDLGFKD
jgi:hypothetical protein